MNQSSLVNWVTAVYLILSALVILFATITICRVLNSLRRVIFGPEAVLGTDPRTRTIAFGVAALAFPNVLVWTVYLSTWVFVALFSELPRWWLNNWQQAVQLCSGGTESPRAVSQCLGQAGFGFLQALGSGLADAYKSIGVNDIPFRDGVFFLTLWAVLAQFFSTSDAAEGGGGKPSFRLQAAYARLSDTGRQNLHFFVVLAVAGYLSIAAIAAIPSLQETTQESTQISPEQLKKEIGEGGRRIDVKEFEANDPFKVLDALLDSPPNVTPATSPSTMLPTTGPAMPNAQPDVDIRSGAGRVGVPAPTLAQSVPSRPLDPASTDWANSRRAVVIKALQTLKQHRQELRRTLEELMRVNVELADKARNSAVTIYSINAERKGSRERTQHFQDLIGWYRESISTLDNAMSNCEQSLRRAYTYWTDWSESSRNELERASQDLLGLTVPQSLYRVYEEARVSCQPVRVNLVAPPRPALGSFLGPFGIVASWLVRTESLPLALIVGLLGFGLLGSACSTFVREQATKPGGASPRTGTDGGPVVSDHSSVVIRGLSAAVVVFLAVEGGLAIFATTKVEPNPYVLLLTCLIAAVFSEDVWAWAHKRLRDSFSGGESDDSAAPTPVSSTATAKSTASDETSTSS